MDIEDKEVSVKCKTFKIKVTEVHSDIIDIKAEDEEEAIDLALHLSSPTFEYLRDCQVLSVKEET